MTPIQIVILIFVALETANVFALYFAPSLGYANAMGAFRIWEKAQAHPEFGALVRYLVNWVAGTKLIFIALLLVIVWQGDARTQTLSAAALTLSIATFYWRLFPLIRQMDYDGQINPPGYAAVLGWMIGVFVLVFAVVTLLG